MSELIRPYLRRIEHALSRVLEKKHVKFGQSYGEVLFTRQKNISWIKFKAILKAQVTLFHVENLQIENIESCEALRKKLEKYTNQSLLKLHFLSTIGPS